MREARARAKKPKTEASHPAAAELAPRPAPAPAADPIDRRGLRSFPLDVDETRLFEFRLPKGGVTRDEALRVAMHLASFVNDGMVDPGFRGEVAELVRTGR